MMLGKAPDRGRLRRTSRYAAGSAEGTATQHNNIYCIWHYGTSTTIQRMRPSTSFPG